MSRREHVFNIENLDKWLEWLESLDKEHLERFQSRVLRTAGLRILEYADDLTPRRSGRLQNSMTMGDRENVFKLKVGRTAYVAVGSAVEYAEAREKGFEQRRGRFIPGYWRSGTFHYDPEAYPEGMVLTGKIIEGAHMFKKAMDYLEDDLDTITEFEFRRLYAELFN
jgi:hypothetical protein